MALYAVYDRVAEAGPCFLAVNDGVAVRNFRALLRNSQVVAEEEYMLYKLGTYDSKTMKVIGEEPVRGNRSPDGRGNETTQAPRTGGDECQ